MEILVFNILSHDIQTIPLSPQTEFNGQILSKLSSFFALVDILQKQKTQHKLRSKDVRLVV